jgi:integrase
LTRRSYQHHLDTYLLPCIGNIPLAMLTAADLRVMFTAIARRRPAAGGPLSPATLARIRATLRAALNAAIREGLISVNPARLVELPAPARPHPVVWTAPREAAWREAGVRPAVAVWTAGQTARFLSAIRGEPLYPCYQLMAVSGLRRGEAAGLRWCDIDFAGTTLTVSRQLQETSRGLVLLPPKSIAGNRVLALDPWTLQVLAAHRGRQQLPAGCDGYVVARPGGRPYPDAQVRLAGPPGGTAPDPAPRPQARRCHPRPGQRRRPQGDPGHARPREHHPDRRHLHQRAARPRPRNGGGGGRADPEGRPDTPGLTAAPPWPHAPAT